MARLGSGKTLTLLASLFYARYVSAAPSVFAHFMAQNTPTYTPETWAKDISSAQSIGIDGFALNIASASDYEPAKVNDAFKVASDQNFSLFFSFDLTYPWESSQIVDLVSQNANQSSMFKYNGDILISSFAGGDKPDSFWQDVKSQLKSKGFGVSLAPAFIDKRDPGQAQSVFDNTPSIDGFLNWWSWPNDVNQTLTTDLDLAFKKAIKDAGRTGPFIMSVSPWQFKDLPNGQNWVEQSDTLPYYRWEQAVKEVLPDIVEIVTWNDFGESHYISDINPNVDLQLAANYVDGIDHAAWRDIAEYYTKWFKTGQQPEITEDKVVFWYRIHPRATTCSGGDPPRMSDFPADAVFALSFLTSDATVSLTAGSSNSSFEAKQGLTMGQVFFPPDSELGGDGIKPSATVVRGDVEVATGEGSVGISTDCKWYNFNPVVGKTKPTGNSGGGESTSSASQTATTGSTTATAGSSTTVGSSSTVTPTTASTTTTDGSTETGIPTVTDTSSTVTGSPTDSSSVTTSGTETATATSSITTETTGAETSTTTSGGSTDTTSSTSTSSSETTTTGSETSTTSTSSSTATGSNTETVTGTGTSTSGTTETTTVTTGSATTSDTLTTISATGTDSATTTLSTTGTNSSESATSATATTTGTFTSIGTSLTGGGTTTESSSSTSISSTQTTSAVGSTGSLTSTTSATTVGATSTISSKPSQTPYHYTFYRTHWRNPPHDPVSRERWIKRRAMSSN